jgi:hypothetical protein
MLLILTIFLILSRYFFDTGEVFPVAGGGVFTIITRRTNMNKREIRLVIKNGLN